MKIAVTDANIFIDLIHLGLHVFISQLNLEIFTTQNVLDELDEEQIQILDGLIGNKSLTIYAFSDEEYEAFSDFSVKRGLSVADHSVLFIAEKLSALILSGDSLLRKTCEERKFEVHGILWIIDECIRCRHLTYQEAHKKLCSLMEYNKRLPSKECNERLVEWEAKT